MPDDIVSQIEFIRDKSLELFNDCLDLESGDAMNHLNGSACALLLVLERGGVIPLSVVSEYTEYLEDWIG
jgi:hypothetical protein